MRLANTVICYLLSLSMHENEAVNRLNYDVVDKKNTPLGLAFKPLTGKIEQRFFKVLITEMTPIIQKAHKKIDELF